MVEKKLAMQGIVEGLDLDNPIGMNPDTYASVKEYAGFYTPLLQSIASVGDLALRGLNTAAYGVAGAAGDIVGDERLTKDLKAMYQMPFFGGGASIPSNFNMPIKFNSYSQKIPKVYLPSRKKPARITSTRVENLPKKPIDIKYHGEEGLFHKALAPAKQYASTETNVFPVVKTKDMTVKQFAYDVAKRNVKNIQESKGTNPKFVKLFDDNNNYIGGYHKGGRQIKLPLGSFEATEGKYVMEKFRYLLDDTYEFSDDVLKQFPGIKESAARTPLNKLTNTQSSLGYALSSPTKPFTDTASINKIKTLLLNMQPEQRKLIFKRLANPTARKEILRTFSKIQGSEIAALTALSSIATASAIKKKD